MTTGTDVKMVMHSTSIVVSNQEKSLAFFTGTLGWEVSDHEQIEPGMNFVTVRPVGNGTRVSLIPRDWFDDGREPGGATGIAFTTPDIEAAYATLSTRGVKFNGKPELMPWGQKTVEYLDLDDNVFFMVEQD